MTIANCLHIGRAYSRNFGQCSILAKKGTFLKKGHLKLCTRSTACTKPHTHTWPINCNTIPQKDTIIPYMAQPCYPLNGQVFVIFFPFATTPANTIQNSLGGILHSMVCSCFHFISWLTLFCNLISRYLKLLSPLIV